MDSRPTSDQPSHFDLLTQPFRLLGIDPAATSRQVNDAFEIARLNHIAADGVLSSARDAILDPLRRLSCELAYPLDGPAAETPALFAALADAASTSELLVIADRLAPLARSNFVAHIAAHRPANSELLYALLVSHIFMDPTQIFEVLKTFRAAAGIPAPALVNVNQGLDELLHIHISAALAGFDTIDQAAEPVLTCAQRILEHKEDYYVKVLRSFLGPYRELIKARQATRAQQIDIYGQALRDLPTDVASLERFTGALNEWATLCRPLMLAEVNQAHEPEFQVSANYVRSLIADLATREHYDVALLVAHVASEVFGLIPATLEQFSMDIELVERLSLQSKLKPLEGLIAHLESEPAALIAALAAQGFGQTSMGPSRPLWETFLQVLKATDELKPIEPWRLVRNLAMRLGRDRGFPGSAAAILLGLIRHGDVVAVAPEVLQALRRDLAAVTPVQLAAPIVAKRKVKRPPGAIAVWVAGLVLAAALAGLAFYLGFDRPPFIWFHTASRGSGETASTTYTELMPAVGTGQHLALAGVRYCHYQAERLRIIKEQAQSPEDIRAFNLLAVDYNARCSDFFYQENDLKRVMAEVAARRTKLEADARNIMASWPGHDTDRANPQR